jgi:RHS repeat-associated protein
VRIALYNYMNSGWVAYDDVSLIRSDTIVVRKYSSAGSRVAMRENDTLYYLFGDHLGSTAITANYNGSQWVEYGEVRYKPWGEDRFTSGTTPTTNRFTGQRQESAVGGGSGLYFYNARWYDPALGRFVSADTIVPEPGNPQAWNRYSYVLNSPLRYTDPTGHSYYDPGCDCMVQTHETENENPELLWYSKPDLEWNIVDP